MLRAIGASRRQVMRAVLAEAVVVGVIASALGLVAGIGVATGLKALLGSVGLDIPTVRRSSAEHDRRVAGRRCPRDPGRRRSCRHGGRRRLPRSRRCVRWPSIAPPAPSAAPRPGLVVTALGVAALLAGLSGAEVGLVGLGAVVVFVGVSVLGPVLARPVARRARLPAAKHAGHGGRARPAERHAQPEAHGPHRGVADDRCRAGGVHHDLRRFGEDVDAGSLGQDYHGTHIVDSGAFDGTAGLSPELAATLRGRPASMVSEHRVTQAEVDGMGRARSIAFDPTTIGQLFDLGNVEGDLTRSAPTASR